MDEDIKTIIKAKVENTLKNAYAVLETFVDYFGEDYVDNNLLTDESLTDFFTKELWESTTKENFSVKEPFYDSMIACLPGSTFSIKVYFPRVTVTNEYGKSIDIKDLYAKIKIFGNGLLANSFTLLRSTYTVAEWICRYAHSHLPGITYGWESPCLGEGPIRNTQNELTREFNIDRWGLFCYELAKYVTIESISGGPYKRLEGVNEAGQAVNYFIPYIYNMRFHNPGGSEIMQNFFKYYLSKESIKISYKENNFVLGESKERFWVAITKSFIQWVNEKNDPCYNLWKLLGGDILGKYIIQGETIYRIDTKRLRSVETDVDLVLTTFKNKEVRLVVEADQNRVQSVYLLEWDIVSYIIITILKIFNYKYGKQNNEETTSTESRCLYF